MIYIEPGHYKVGHYKLDVCPVAVLLFVLLTIIGGLFSWLNENYIHFKPIVTETLGSI